MYITHNWMIYMKTCVLYSISLYHENQSLGSNILSFFYSSLENELSSKKNNSTNFFLHYLKSHKISDILLSNTKMRVIKQ